MVKLYRKWDIVEDTNSNDDFKYMLVSSSNKNKIYGYPIVLRQQKMHTVKRSIENTEYIKKIDELDINKLAIKKIEGIELK